jgi:hypothetical protein
LCSNRESAKQIRVGSRPAPRHRTQAPAPPWRPRPRSAPTEATHHPIRAPFPGRPVPRGALEPAGHAPPRRRAVRAPCTRRTAGPYACVPRSTVVRQHLVADVMATRDGSIQAPPPSRASLPSHPCRAPPWLPSPLGELLPAPSAKLHTHAHPLPSDLRRLPMPRLAPPSRRAARPQRPVPPRTTDRAHRRRSTPAFGHVWVVGELPIASPPSPGQAPARPRRNRGRAAGGQPQGPNCRVPFLFRGLGVN